MTLGRLTLGRLGTNVTIKNNPIVPKKNEHIEHILKNIGTISKRTEQNRAEIA